MSKLKYYDGTNWKIVNGQITGDTLPIGAIVPYGSATAPTNWLVCDGSAVSRTTYAELFAVIGTSFGSGDGSTTFNLPNLKGRVAVGQDITQTEFDTIGETGGYKNITLGEGNLPWSVPIRKNASGDGFSQMEYGLEGWQWYANNNFEHGQPFTILQPYQVVCYIIKAKQSAGIVANVSNIYSTSQSDTYSCDYINDCNAYSTSETFTGKYWIDNKPIYRKVIYMASPSRYEDIQTGITSSNIIWYDAIVSTGGGYINKINSTEWDVDYRIIGDIDPSGKFRFRAGPNQTQIADLNVIIEYTKSN